MTLLYRCDECGDTEQGDGIPGLTAEITDCMPDHWALCHHDRSKPVVLLCGECYWSYRKRS